MGNEQTNDRDSITLPAPAIGHAPVRLPAARTRQPWGRLLKALLDLAGEHAQLVSHVERDWASATFSGSRHGMAVCFTGDEAAEAGEAFIVALPDHEFLIPRYLVADAQILAVDDRQLPERTLMVDVELLLLDRA